MGIKIIIKIVTECASELFKALQILPRTTLPYRWDFCRDKFNDSTRFHLNYGTYIIVYTAFVFWFIKSVAKSLKASSKLNIKDWFIIASVSFIAASQLLWPTLLISTYFITCSYYPWMSSFLVMFLNYPMDVSFFHSLYQESELMTETSDILHRGENNVPAIARLLSKSTQTMLKHPYETLRKTLESEISNILSTYLESESTKEDCPIPEYHQPGSEENLDPTAKPYRDSKNQNSVVFTELQSVVKNLASMSDTEYEQHISTASSSSREEKAGLEEMQDNITNEMREKIILETLQNERTIKCLTQAQENLPDNIEESKIPRPTKKRIPKSSNKKQEKMGYCGRCFRGNNLPFLQGFSGLREARTTRSGLVHGPTVRFLKRDEYIKEYGL